MTAKKILGATKGQQRNFKEKGSKEGEIYNNKTLYTHDVYNSSIHNIATALLNIQTKRRFTNTLISQLIKNRKIITQTNLTAPEIYSTFTTSYRKY